VVFGFVLAVFAIIQKSNWNGRIYWFRHIPGVAAPFGPFVNRNHFAGFVGMLIPLGLGIVSEMKGSEKRLLYLFMTVIMAVGVVLSLSRGGILSMLASLAFFSALVFMRKQRGKKPVFYIWLFFSVFLLYAFYMGAGPFLERLSSEGVTDKLRLAAWKGTLGAYRDFWLLGTGLSTFRDVFPAYDQGLKAFFQYAHNDYLQLIMETGSLGGALALWFLISLSRGTARLYRLQKASYISIGIAASIFYMLVHSFFDFNLHIPSNAITFSMLLGFMAAFVYKEELYLDGKRRLYFSANGVDQIP
jgi:O-antigen ligase